MRVARSDLELEVLYNRVARGELDLQPDFQRGEVWDRARQARLIDTILRRWYVPSVHIVRDEKSQRDLVLDGQQRLRTVLAFFNDEIKVVGKLDPINEELLGLDGLRYSQLPLEYQRRFQRFEIGVVTLTDYKPEEPSELFFRLNQQYSLTPPEKRNALFGVARDQVKYIVAQLVDNEALSQNKIGFGNGRLAYDDVIARFCLVLQEETLRRHISNNFVEDFYRHGQFGQGVIEEAIAAGEFLGAALDRTFRVKFNKATLFSWLVFVHSGSSPDKQDLTRFLDVFESARVEASEYSSKGILALVRAYSDRASYRVLDVTSVLLRDLVLHAVHASLGKPVGREIELLPLLERPYDIDTAEATLLEFIDATGWGATI